jgi:hypothetical protein
VRAGGGAPTIRVCLFTDGGVLAIEVWDQAPGVPVLCEAAALAVRGRGLAIIDTLTSGRWGCHLAIGRRWKCVWAQIPLHDQPARQFLP